VYTVTHTFDDTNPGSLRWAITQANADVNSPHTIDLTGVSGTITLTSALPNISRDMTITGPGAGSLTINGANAYRIFSQSTANLGVTGLKLSGGFASGSGGAIAQASAGGENLTITNCVIIGCSATSYGGAIYNAYGGTITITGSTVQNCGSSRGALAVAQLSITPQVTVNLTNSQVFNNASSGNGGALNFYWPGVLNVDHSTIAGNSGNGVGGGIYFYGNSAGVTINASTIANNTSTSIGGGIIMDFAGATPLTITSSTITGNSAVTGGGIGNNGSTGTITLHNSIITGNQAGTGPDISSSSTVNSSYDAVGNTAGFSYAAGTGDLSQTSSTAAALHLGPLTAKTGPNGTFQIIPFTSLSTAVDAGDPALNGTTDQLGRTRPQDPTSAQPDIGAFERIPGPDAAAATHNVTSAAEPVTYTLTVTYTDTVNIDLATLDSNDVSVIAPAGVLPVAVSYVGNDATNPHAVVATYQFTAPGGSWDTFDDGVYTISMNANQVSDAHGYAQAGPIGTFNVLIPRVLTVTNTGDAGTGSGQTGDLRYCITQSNADAAAGVPETIDMTGVTGTISLSSALPALSDPALALIGPGAPSLSVVGGSGAFRIFAFSPAVTSSSLTMSGFTISGGNSGTGAGICVFAGNLSLTNVVLSGNSTTSAGGAVYNASTGSIMIANCTLQNNTSAGGGAVYNSSSGSLTITGSQLLNNRSTSTAGAVYNSGGQLTLTGDMIQGNSASSTGIVYSNASSAVPTSVSNTVIQGNTANGAAFWNASTSPVTMTNCQILNNGSTGTGGGILNGSDGALTLTGDTISGNSSALVGAGVYNASGPLTVTNTTIANNTVGRMASGTSGDGGGIACGSMAGAGVVISNCSITGNTAMGSAGAGGGVYFYGTAGASGVSITNSTIANNVAVNGAGIELALLNGNFNLTSDTISGNTATSANVLPGVGGGGIGLRSVTNTAGAVANVNLDNTIISGNLAANGFNDISAVPALTPLMTTAITAKYSAIGSTAGFKLTDNGNNLVGLTNALLGPVGSNGAMTPLAGSPVVNTGDPALNGTTDQLGTSRPQGGGVDIGAVERVVNHIAASAAVSNVMTLAAAGNPTYQFTVTYADDVNINTGSITAANVLIGVPAGVTAPAVSVASVNSSNPHKVIVTYQFTAPGGSWVLADAGSYSVIMNANQVSDANGSVPAGPLASFVVAPPQTFTVTDTLDDTNPGSLRYAITQANAVAAANLFTPVPSVIVFSNSTAGGAVNFYDGATHTITLSATSALPTVADNLTITGPGSGVLTVNRSSGAFQILPISNPAASIAVNLNGMTLSGAVNTATGGAIADTNAAALNLTDVTIKNNSTSSFGGGIYLDSAGTAVTLTNCTLQANTSSSTTGGGAILFGSTGGLSMTRSMVLANRSAGSGAGIFVGSASYITITQSTIADNSATTSGGGLRLYGTGASLLIDRSTLSGNTAGTGSGGGVYAAGAIGGNGFKIVNSTIANNTAAGPSGSGGGLAFSGAMLGAATIVGSTITGNSAGAAGTAAGTGGGGIALLSASTASGAYSTITLDNTIVSGNSAANGRPDISATANGNPVVSDYYSAIGSTNGYSPTNLGGSLPVGANLLLGILENNGGPTQTVSLNGASPAIDAGDPALGGASLPGATDQRGTLRPQGIGVDIGAFERSNAELHVNSVSAPDVTSAAANPVYTFSVTYASASAVQYASVNGNSNAVTVTAPPGVPPVAVSFVSATPTTNASTITATYQFTAPGGAWTMNADGLWTINQVANQISAVNNTYAPAGPIGTFRARVPRALTVTSAGDTGAGSGSAGDLRYCITTADGDTASGTPDIIGFSSSTVGGTTNFYDGTLHAITLASALPALVAGSDVTITGPGASVLTVNAAGTGRMFTAGGASLSVSGMTMTGGQVAGVGGAIDLITGNLTLTNSVVTGNSASSGGGGVYVAGNNASAVVNVTGTTISANTTNGRGGAIGIGPTGPTLNVVNSSLINNLAAGNGGAIDYHFRGTMTIDHSTIAGNSAGGSYGGGGVYYRGLYSNVTVSNSTIANNTAGSSTGSGGGIMFVPQNATAATIRDSTITGNVAATTTTAAGYGGGGLAVRSGAGVIVLNDSILSGNVSGNGFPEISSALTVASTYCAIDSTAGFIETAGTGDVSGASATPAALHLQPLANNGGPTQTIGFGAGSPLLNAGDPNTALATDQRGVPRVIGPHEDIGAYEYVPITVAGVQVNDGSAQRSEVRSLTVTFSGPVTFAGGNANAAFQLQRVQTGNNVGLAATVGTNGSGQTVVTLTFSGSETDQVSGQNGGALSLADGRYQLTVNGAAVTDAALGWALDGDANGVPGGNYVTPAETSYSSTALHLYRLFGDATGDGVVDLSDLTAFRSTYNAGTGNLAYVSYLDADNSGVVDLTDLTEFRNRYNHSVFV
jgi:hypothetical protein